MMNVMDVMEWLIVEVDVVNDHDLITIRDLTLNLAEEHHTKPNNIFVLEDKIGTTSNLNYQ